MKLPNKKELIKARISNQLRIHWHWIKKQEHEEVSKFINSIVDTWWEGKPKMKTRTLKENIITKLDEL